ncbi:MAG: DUF5106 domain-containing protein [Cyclobacteriaceae bacterium]|nr:DUF5106 domain-containing protein [Cyclobacteriaceae bacterium]
MRPLILLLVGICSFAGLQAQPGYQLDFAVKGLKDTTVFLAYNYGESTYIRDTARVDSKGTFSFAGSKNLPQGVYMLVLKTTPIFEIVISADQRFAMETSSDDYIEHMKVSGDEDNQLFFENMRFNKERHNEALPYLKVIQDSTLQEDQKKEAREKFKVVNDKVLAYQSDIIQKHPGSLTARIFRISRTVDIPEAPKLPNGKTDSTFQFRYYKQHYWDNFDVADDALIRMPRAFYSDKLKDYFDRLVLPQADSVIKEIDKLAARAKKNQETYKYLVWMLVIKYQNPEIMGLDKVYVHLYDKYFASGEMDFWIDRRTKQNLKEHADKMRVSMMGMTGQNLVMQDQNLQPRSLYDIKKKYTILFFFSPDCGHCRAETPKFVSFYEKNKIKFDFEVYAIDVDTSMKKMRDFIKEMKMTWVTVNGPRSYVGQYTKYYDAYTTPTVYILDDKKKIIAKKPPIEKLGDFLEHYSQAQKSGGGTAKPGASGQRP